MRPKTHLILALDVTDRAKALAIAKACVPFLDAIKVNYPLVLGAGLDIVRDLANLRPVICDFKVADVPNTNRLITELAFAHGAAGIIVHVFPGEDSLKASLDAAKGDVYVVAEMSHPGAEHFNAAIADDIAHMAVKLGAAGIIAPATRPERLQLFRQIVGKKLILSPGVGAQGGSAGWAIRMGADFAIVGRSIYQAEEPAPVAEKIAGEIGGAGRAGGP